MIRTFMDTKVAMPDGVRLSTDVYLPEGDGPFPTILMRTPYDNNQEAMILKARRLAESGYACVVQDCRGRFDSEGSYYPFVAEGPDGDSTLTWIGEQPWSDGQAGMAGGSYVGWVQWTSATFANPVLRCIAPRVMATDLFTGLQYLGGAFQLNVMMTWGMRTSGHTAQSIAHDDWRETFRGLPLREAAGAAGRDLAFWRDWLDHPTKDAYWAPYDVDAHIGDIQAPALILSGWFDLYSAHAFTSFNGLRAAGSTPGARASRIVVGPWPHALSASTKTGDVEFGPASMIDLEDLELRWFDHWLKGAPPAEDVVGPPVRLFIMGARLWRDEQEWPLARTDWQPWYFHSGGHANTLLGDGVLSPVAPADEPVDTFAYDPIAPVQTVGGNNCCSPDIVPWGPYDQRDVEMRPDVLCYTSAPLESDLEVTGPVRVVLHAATDGLDTDWTAKLVDVRPSGYAMNLCDGILRARYRDSITEPTLLEPGRIYEYEIDVMVTANVFKAGHRIRVEISSSNFPRHDRNLNTGGPIGLEPAGRVAHQTIHHSSVRPSHIILPVIPVG